VDFSNIDLLIGTVMNYQQWNMIDIPSIFGPRYDRVNIFYSNPDYYSQQKRLSTNQPDTSVEWPVKTDDFFPYSDCPHCFWTGYFTSRAALKRFERVASSFLLAARQIDALTPIDPSLRKESVVVSESPLYPLEDAVSIAQHHDAVSGTAKQHVADDYSLKLAHGLDLAAQYAIQLLKRRMFPPDAAGQSQLENLAYCPLLNETICDVSVVRLIFVTL
jgi:Alpha mannosidase middle domain